MKKTILTALITILTLAGAKTQAQVLNLDVVKSQIVKGVIEDCKQYTDAEIEATVLGLPFSVINIPDGNVTYKITSIQKRLLPRDLKHVGIYVNGKIAKEFNAPISIKAFKNVLVATTFIERDKTITPMVAAAKRMNVADRMDYTISADMFGKDMITKKMFSEGEIIDQRFLKMKPDVVRNENVEVYFSTNTLVIGVQGRALTEGNMGDYVTVENRDYRRTYRGKVIGQNKILVNM